MTGALPIFHERGEGDARQLGHVLDARGVKSLGREDLLRGAEDGVTEQAPRLVPTARKPFEPAFIS